jgi:hypothetical protein
MMLVTAMVAGWFLYGDTNNGFGDYIFGGAGLN